MSMAEPTGNPAPTPAGTPPEAAPPEPPGAARWRPADLGGLIGRIEAARSLLEQAAAMAIAADTARITNMTHLQDQLGKERDGHDDGRRRYR
jgi:hypothetical protein